MAEISVSADSVFPILRDNILVDGFHVVIDLQKSHGSVIVDALEGKEYLDCYGYFSSLTIGHNHPEMEDEGFRSSLMAGALSNPANADIYSREYAAFVKTFREIAVPEDFRYLFFIAGGALAVENAMKVAFDWKAQKNRAAGIEGGADKILHFRDAFHGRSGYTMSVTNTVPAKIADFPKFDWPRVSNPAIHRYPDEAALAEAEEQSAREIEDAFEADPHSIAAILLEPIQGEGGDNHFRPGFLMRLRAIADEREALLLYDEIQTGGGMTGTMWAFQQLGAVPDIVAFGKKTQICGIMSTRRVDEVESNVFHVPSRINSTWGGNLVDMIRSARYLQIMREESLVENAAKVGAFFKEGLERLQADFPQVSSVRGRGFFLALDLPDTETRNGLNRKCWENGLAVLNCGNRSIRFRPPLIFSEADVEEALGILTVALNQE